MENTAVIIAAGLGTRMKSTLPKAAHKLAGREMLRHITMAAEEVFDRVVVVLGPDMPALEALAAPHGVVVQAERLGTAHAANLSLIHIFLPEPERQILFPFSHISQSQAFARVIKPF